LREQSKPRSADGSTPVGAASVWAAVFWREEVNQEVVAGRNPARRRIVGKKTATINPKPAEGLSPYVPLDAAGPPGVLVEESGAVGVGRAVLVRGWDPEYD
jgi:hypothetical protein